MLDAKRLAEMMQPDKMRLLADTLDCDISAGYGMSASDIDTLCCAAAVLREVAGPVTYGERDIHVFVGDVECTGPEDAGTVVKIVGEDPKATQARELRDALTAAMSPVLDAADLSLLPDSFAAVAIVHKQSKTTHMALREVAGREEAKRSNSAPAQEGDYTQDASRYAAMQGDKPTITPEDFPPCGLRRPWRHDEKQQWCTRFLMRVTSAERCARCGVPEEQRLQ